MILFTHKKIKCSKQETILIPGWPYQPVSLGPYMAAERIGLGALIFLAYLSQPIAAMTTHTCL